MENFGSLFSNEEFMRQLQTALHTHPELLPPGIVRRTDLPRDKYKPSVPQTFNGKDKKLKVTDHLFEVGRYLRQLEVVEEVRKVDIASSLLEGDARSWYRFAVGLNDESIDVSYDQIRMAFPTYEKYCEKLRNAFRGLSDKDHARDELRNWRQKSSVVAAVGVFRAICMRIPGIAEDEMLDRFVYGLKSTVRIEVLRNGLPGTLDEAIALADRIDRNQFEASKRKQESTVSDNHPVPMDLSVVSIDNRYRGKLTPELKKLLQTENRCFYCRHVGCSIDRCPRRTKKE